MATFDWAVKWLREGKAVIREQFLKSAIDPSRKAIWWDPGQNRFYRSKLWADEEVEQAFIDPMTLDCGWEIVEFDMWDFTATDWVIFESHQSESDAWLDGDLPSEVELVSGSGPKEGQR